MRADSAPTPMCGAAPNSAPAADVAPAADFARVAASAASDFAADVAPPADVSLHEALLSRVTFHFGDGTVGRALQFTHVYAFDRVFSPTTMRALAALLRRSPFYVFASFRTPAEWWACGLTTVHPIAKLRVTTTGKESMSITIYANLRQAPRSSQD